jgi:malonyl-CoA O-methyltransferase
VNLEPHAIDEFAIDKRQVRRSFERAADSYDAAAFLQQEIGDRLVERLDLVRLEPQQIVDVGAGTGHVSAALGERYPDSRLLVTDIAEGMLQCSRRRLQPGVSSGLAGLAGLLKRTLTARRGSRFAYVSADAEQLPLADASTDLLVSNLMLQWCPDLDRALAEFRRVLTPGGLLMFTTFGPDTLKELRAAWAEVDGLTHVNAFIDMHDIGDAVMRAGLGEPVMDAERMTVTYPELLPLMRDLKDIGAHHVSAGRRHGMTGRQRLSRVAAAYEQWRSDGVLPASYEVIYGHAWAPLAGKPVSRGGEQRVQLDSLRRG